MSVTVGARYTKDKKDMQINAPLTDSTLTALVGLVTGTANNAVFNFTPGLISSSDEWTSFDPRLAVDYAITSELLVYASIAKGFKSGGFNRQPLLPGDSGILSFDAEENTAFEIGLKTDFWERRARVNLALYQYDYEDFQLETNRGGAILIQNAANLETSGIEVEARFLLTERIDLRVAFARQKAEFDKGSIDDGAGTIVDLKGLDAPRAPKTTASLIADFQITDQIDFNLSYTHTDEMFYTADNRVELLAEDFQLVNARLNFSSSDDRWGASIVGENLTDEEYTSSMIDFLLPMALPGMGRLIRVEARYNF
jgi:iron complex outermembrane receptor protein